MAFDPEHLRRAFRVYRAVKLASRTRDGYTKTKAMLVDHAAQSDQILDGAAFARRVLHQQVRPDDIRAGARIAINSTPRVLQVVARHIRKKQHAKT